MTGALTIAVSGLHLGENPQPGPGVIRSLREAIGGRLRIVGLAYDAFDSSLHAGDLLDDAFLVPYPSAGPEAYLERLLAIRREVGLDVLIPCLDVELPVLDLLRERLSAAGIRTFIPHRAELAARAKDRLPELGARLGISVPETLPIADEAALAQVGEVLGYPFVLKGPFCEAEIIHGQREALPAFRKLVATWGLPLLAQRFVTGEEYNVIALGDGVGGVHGAVAMRKTIVTRLGKAWGAVTVDDPELIATARTLVSALRWRGGCEIELMRERRGKLHLIEVNPRFPAWVYLATAAGVNLPLGLVRLALGSFVPRYETYQAGVFTVRHAVEVTGSLATLGELVGTGQRLAAQRRTLPSDIAPVPHFEVA